MATAKKTTKRAPVAKATVKAKAPVKMTTVKKSAPRAKAAPKKEAELNQPQTIVFIIIISPQLN